MRKRIWPFAGIMVFWAVIVGFAGINRDGARLLPSIAGQSKSDSGSTPIKSISFKEELSIRFPKDKPFFTSLIPMEEGRLAVVVGYEGYEAVWLAIFDPEGRFLGRVKAQIPMMNVIYKKGKAYSLHRDENGFLSIKRYGCEIK